MARDRVAASAVIPAPPERVYAIIADYRTEHPKILPPRYFRNLQVEEGGYGAGTRIRFEMTMMGTARALRGVVSEPEPGRVLMESDPGGFSDTTFTLEPQDGGRATRLTIATDFNVRPGLGGAIERRLAAWMLRRVYVDELALIAAHAAGLATG